MVSDTLYLSTYRFMVIYHCLIPRDSMAHPCSPDLIFQMACRPTPTRLHRSVVTENYLSVLLLPRPARSIFTKYALMHVLCIALSLQDIPSIFFAETTGCSNFHKVMVTFSVSIAQPPICGLWHKGEPTLRAPDRPIARFYINFIILTFTQTVSARKWQI